MPKRIITHSLFTLATAAGLLMMGCGTDVSEGNLPPSKPATLEESKAASKKVMEGMGGMYKGAPGVPKPKG
jgi:hypothetical protein